MKKCVNRIQAGAAPKSVVILFFNFKVLSIHTY